MRGCLVFIGGYIAGFVSVLLLIFVLAALTTNDRLSSSEEKSVAEKSTTIIKERLEVKDYNINLFDEPAECVSTSDFKIEEVIDEYYAIADEVEYNTVLKKYYSKYAIKVVIKSEEKNKYFDEQIIKMPAGKCMRQVGVYTKYSDTYPVVKISE
jgi:maltose-binding protein MalE